MKREERKREREGKGGRGGGIRGVRRSAAADRESTELRYAKQLL